MIGWAGVRNSTDRPGRSGRLRAAVAVGVLAAIPLFWVGVVQPVWREYTEILALQRAAEDSVPIGYIGLNYRRTYNDRPRDFLIERDGRRLLWGAMDETGRPAVFFDVTDAGFDPRENLSGGFGLDSVPGVDFPIFEQPDSVHGQNFRRRQAVFGLAAADGPRAYPLELLQKIEVVNDRDSEAPIVVTFSRGEGQASCYSRVVDGRPLTLGTTGYHSQERPLLYDRRTRSLWLPSPGGLDCVCGELKGTRLPVHRPLSSQTWGEWTDDHPKTLVLVGNDRSRPIPPE